MKPVAVVASTEDRLKALILEALAEYSAKQHREAKAEAQALSCVQAARLAKRRRSAVAAAMASGALDARRSGRNWRTTVADVREWMQRGCPT